MSDEAFARRFYSDRAELLALGVPLQSQRDEFTGEELYTLSSEQYFLPQLELEDEELAALQTALYLLEGKFAYAEPLRLALQNLALGRPGFDEAPTETALRVEVVDPDYTRRDAGSAREARERDLEAAHGQVPVLVDLDRQAAPSARSTPTRCTETRAAGTSSVTTSTVRTCARSSVSRIAGDIRFATRRERDFRMPTEFDVDTYRGRPALADRRTRTARRGSRWRGDTAWWVSASSATAAGSRTASSSRRTRACRARLVGAPPGRPRDADRADELRRDVAAALKKVRTAHEGEPPEPAPTRSRRERVIAGRAPRRPGRARAVRRAPGASRVPARPLRRGRARPRSPRASSSSASTSRRTSSRSTSRSSTSSTSAAAVTRSTPSSTATTYASTRSSTATRSARRRG